MCTGWRGVQKASPGNYDSDEVCVHGGGPRGTSECSKCFAMGAGLHLMMQMKHVYQDWDKKCAPDLGLNMCFRTGIKHMDWNWDLTCVPRLGSSICTGTGIKHVYGAFPWQPGRAQRVPWHRGKLKYNLNNLNKT